MPAAVGVADDDGAFLHADVVAVIGVGAAGRGVGGANHHAAVPAAFAGIEGGLHGVVLPVLAAGNRLDIQAVADVHLAARIRHNAVTKNDPAILTFCDVAEIVGKGAGDAPRIGDAALLGQGLHGKFLRLGEDAVDAHLHLSIVGGVRLQAGEIRDTLVVPLGGHGVVAALGAIVHRIEAVGAVDVGGELDGVHGGTGTGHLGFLEGTDGDDLDFLDGHGIVSGETHAVIVLIAEAEGRICHQILQISHRHRGLPGGEIEGLRMLGVDIEGQFTRTGISHHHPVGIGVGDNDIVKLYGIFAFIAVGLRGGCLSDHRVLSIADPGDLIDMHAGAARGDQLNLHLQIFICRQGRVRRLRHRVAHELPVRYQLPGDLQGDGRGGDVEGLGSHLLGSYHLEGSLDIVLIDDQGVVPVAGRVGLLEGEGIHLLYFTAVPEDGVVGGFAPVLFHLDAEDQRAVLHRKGVIVPGG